MTAKGHKKSAPTLKPPITAPKGPDLSGGERGGEPTRPEDETPKISEPPIIERDVT